MKKIQFGYVGKSVMAATVGIAATIIAACGGGGSTSAGTPSSFVLFASMYHKVVGAKADPFVRTTEGGNVYEFKHAAIGRSWGTDTDETINYRQAYGAQWYHVAAMTSVHHYGLAIKAPITNSTLPTDTNSVDISNTNNLIIQLGNGAGANNTNTHTKYTILLNAGTQTQAPEYAWPYSCTYDQTLGANSRPGDLSPAGLQQYKIPLSSFTCNSASALASVKSGLKEVVVKVVGGSDAASASTTLNDTLVLVGHIAFIKAE
ncbi:MAG: hypothetical protein QM520_01755 [Gammaproteobacteria bacterium]|nr:hypothetical protein [Gammaproteobacteria bacterium]